MSVGWGPNDIFAGVVCVGCMAGYQRALMASLWASLLGWLCAWLESRGFQSFGNEPYTWGVPPFPVGKYI